MRWGRWVAGRAAPALGLAALIVALAGCGPRPGAEGQASPGAQPGRAGGESAPEGLQVGNRAPDFTVTTVDGQELSLAALVTAGRPVVLYFFATW